MIKADNLAGTVFTLICFMILAGLYICVGNLIPDDKTYANWPWVKWSGFITLILICIAIWINKKYKFLKRL